MRAARSRPQCPRAKAYLDCHRWLSEMLQTPKNIDSDMMTKLLNIFNLSNLFD
jgi:hypothetical protein